MSAYLLKKGVRTMRVNFARLPMLVIMIAIVLPLLLTACGGKGGGY
jgi:hypothetical protein